MPGKYIFIGEIILNKAVNYRRECRKYPYTESGSKMFLFFKGLNKDFSGFDLVISAKSESTVNLKELVVGLYLLIPTIM